jgi:hypothetical protein
MPDAYPSAKRKPGWSATVRPNAWTLLTCTVLADGGCGTETTPKPTIT